MGVVNFVCNGALLLEYSRRFHICDTVTTPEVRIRRVFVWRLLETMKIVGWKKPVANWAKRTKPQAGARERTVPWRTAGKMYSRLLGQCGVIAPERGIISYSLSPIVPPIFFITQETTIFPPPRVLQSLHLAFSIVFSSKSSTNTTITPNSRERPPEPKIAKTMAPRRPSTRTQGPAQATSQRARGGIRRNTRSRQPPNRYGQQVEGHTRIPATEGTIEPSSGSGDDEPSIPLYSHSPEIEANHPEPSSPRPTTTTLRS